MLQSTKKVRQEMMAKLLLVTIRNKKEEEIWQVIIFMVQNSF